MSITYGLSLVDAPPTELLKPLKVALATVTTAVQNSEKHYTQKETIGNKNRLKC